MIQAKLFEKIALSDTILISCSEEGLIRHVSDNIQTVFSITPADIINRSVWEMIPESQRELVREQCRLIKLDNVSRVFNLRFDQSGLKFTHFSVNLTYDNKDGYFCILLPQVENGYGGDEGYFRQMEVMRTTLESMDDFVFVLDRNNLFIEFYSHVNQSIISGFSSAFKVGSSLSDVGFPDEVEALFFNQINKAKNERKPQQIDYTLSAFGAELYYTAKISPRFSIDNSYDGVTIVVREVTLSVKSEEKLKKSLEYYLTVLLNFPNPIWRCNALKKFDYFNKTWEEFTGIPHQESQYPDWKTYVYQEDLELIMQEFEEKFKTRKTFQLEYRLIHYTGSYRWVKNFCQPLFDIKGRFIGYIGSCFDIDDIRSTQKLLQASESRYKAMVQEQSDLVVRWKADQTITFVNNSFCNFFDKPYQKLVGTFWIDLFQLRHRSNIKTQIQGFISNGQTGLFETEIQDKLKQKKVFQWLNSPVFDKVGNIIEYQSVGRDITEKIEKDRENQNLLLNLNEKVKELSLLNRVSKYIHDGIHLEQLFTKLSNDISNSFLKPAETFAIIEYNGQMYKSSGFRKLKKYTELAYVFGEKGQGTIKVLRDETNYKNQQLSIIEKSERSLLKIVCELLNSYLQKIDADKKLLQSELRFGELFENVMDIVFSVDPLGEIIKINSAAQKILGFENFADINLWDITTPSERNDLKSMLKRVFSGQQKSFTLETKALTKSGDVVYLQIGGIVKYSDIGRPIEVFGIARDTTEQKRMEQSIIKTVITTEEKERKRFAEDLHDGIGPLLSGLKMYLQQDSLEKDLTEKQQKVLKYCRELVDDAIGQTRSIANNLTPSVLNDFGLEKALVSHVAKINAIGKFQVNLKINSPLKNIESDVSLAVFRIVSELINNALKHAQCNLVEIEIEVKKGIISLLYTDNGKGFDSKSKAGSETSGSKMGINSIYNRVNSLNGSLSLKTSPGNGVMVRIFIPLKE
jgi:PAS domain S-box-containing protein